MTQPVVAVGIIVWNGVETISATLDTLINQTYKNIRIYVLDNQSTDGTDLILQTYSEKDPRIEFYIDTQKRDIAQAQKKVFDTFLVAHEYCMFSCDDDLYEQEYIECVLQELIFNKLDLVYTKYENIDAAGILSSAKNWPLYGKSNSCYINARNYLIFRNCVPIFFGIYKTKSLKNSMPLFKMVDSYGFNHENLMLFHFLLRNKVGYLESHYFFYKLKERIDLYKARGYFFSTAGSKKYFYSLIHNFNISIEFARIIKDSTITGTNCLILYMVLPISYFHRTLYVFMIYPFVKKIFLSLRKFF